METRYAEISQERLGALPHNSERTTEDLVINTDVLTTAQAVAVVLAAAQASA